MALLGRTEVGVKEFGREINVPEHPTAKLMYYLDSICYVLDIDKSEANIRKLRDYRRYRALDDSETEELLILCILFTPDILVDKCIFQDNEMCGGDMNKFFEVSAVSDRFLITPEVLIGGQTRKVQKILFFHEIWLECWYHDPMRSFEGRIRSLTARIRGRGGGQRAITSGETSRPSPPRSVPSGPSRSQQATGSRATSSTPSRAQSGTTAGNRAQSGKSNPPTTAPAKPAKKSDASCVVQ
ncbi:hypothetical protein FSP39_005147 [Pinctada imbricata]|uniref:Uncharacterized protein n=1 Tax=Pinctada imbricata TaxID=66713 RepID=A0AA89BSA4_PINIB|nr:hypothetical protein FSP39_005147 [Pinctada imbricata]